ncbi:DMT family transporter [Inquilinus limosus]|uniref:DMT family transporter n=1 Tax=Inquilinus limosus TaxID=171674 RepID=UPI0004117FEA|nr:DMT family transporter [Inquilinus limosus]
MGAQAAAAPPTARQSPAQGIALYAGGVFVLCVMDAMIKWLSADYPIAQIVFFRATIGLIPTLVMLYRPPGLEALRTRRVGAHLLRGVVGVIGTFGFFWAFAVMPLADAYAIGFAAPMFITAMSVPILGERVGLKRWLAVLVGFAGVMIMIRPGGEGSTFGSGGAIALLATAAYALSMVLMRLYSRTETNASMIFYATLVIIAVAGVQMPFVWVTPSWEDAGLLAVLGLLGGIGAIMMAQAYRVATPSIVVPFEYTGMIWGVGLGFMLWGDVPDLWIWVGSAVVIASGLYILHRETRGRTPSPPAAATDPSGESGVPAS